MNYAIIDFDLSHFRELFLNISDRCRCDIVEMLWDDDYWQFFRNIEKSPEFHEFHQTIVVNDQPIMTLGIDIILPGVAQTWAITRKDLKEYGALVHFLSIETHRMLTSLDQFHRIYTLCSEDDGDAQKWLQHTGYKKEGVMIGHSRSGRDYSIWRFT